MAAYLYSIGLTFYSWILTYLVNSFKNTADNNLMNMTYPNNIDIIW